MRRARILLASAIGASCAAVAFVATGCAGVFGIDDLSSDKFDAGVEASASDTFVPDTSMPIDAAVDAGVDSACGRVGVPDPPASDSPPRDGGDVTFTVAISGMDFGIPPDGGGAPVPVGYNLDRFCTVNVASGNSCVQKADMTGFSQYVADKNADGLDNAGFNLIKYLTTLGDAFKPAEVNARLQSGQFGGVLVVAGYNGGSDDTSVDIEFFPAVGLTGASGTMPVVFGPSDLWITDQAAYVPGTSGSIYHTNAAYVTGGVLVASFSNLAFTMSVSDPDPRLTLSLDDVIVTANVLPATGSTSAFRLGGGVLAGRWATRTFFGAVAPLKYGSSAICTQSTVFNYLIGQVCGARDIMSAGTDDNTGKTCDAISAGMAFETYAVDGIAQGTAPDAGVACADAGDCP